MKTRKPGGIVYKAEIRLKGMQKIDKKYNSQIDFGGPSFPLTSSTVSKQINLCKSANEEYNDALKAANTKGQYLKSEEKLLTDMYTRILSGCVSKFGTDVEEVKMLGGTRISERKSKSKNI